MGDDLRDQRYRIRIPFFVRMVGLPIVNDVEVQRSHTGRDLCWPISEMIAWVTSFMTMMPGDIICTGSAGVGSIRVGDVVDVEIDGIGVLSNPVVAPN